MSPDLLLGVDLGTSRSKILAMSPEGAVLGVTAFDTPWHRVATGAELAAGDMLSSVLEAVGTTRAATGGGRVLGIGITAIGQSGLVVDGAGRPCTPIVIWHDTRASVEAASLADAVGARRFAGITGLAPAPYFAPSMVAWHHAHTPGATAGTRWLGMAEWLAHALGAAPVAEWSLAAQSGFLDTFNGIWSPEIAGWAGVPLSWLPELVGAGDTIGRVGDRYPILAGAALTVAGHDHLCAAVGATSGPGTLYDSCGTAETMLQGLPRLDDHDRAIDAVLQGGLMFGRHVLPGMMCVSGSIPTGRFLGSMLEALKIDPGLTFALDEAALALNAPPRWDDVTVSNDRIPSAAALMQRGEPAVVWRAAIDTAVREGNRVAAALADFAGAPDDWLIGGGWTRNRAFMERKRAALPTLRVTRDSEPGSRGAALFAGLAAGVYGSPGDFPPTADT